MSPILIITAIESGFGLILSCLILYVILSQKRELLHYLFAAFLLISAVWDAGILWMMVRNDYLDELQQVGSLITPAVGLLPALLFHFSNLYTRKPVKWGVILAWLVFGSIFILSLLGLVNKVEGVYSYSWGNIHRYSQSPYDYLNIAVWFVFNLWACWILYKGWRTAQSIVEKRHFLYVFLGTLVITFAIVKVGVAIGINWPVLLPLGMLMVDVLNAIIGIAIVKDSLFDITVIVKKGTLYSLLAALVIFVYSFMEHILVTFVGERIGENSYALHLVAVAISIAVLMPLKNRIERAVERYFAHRKLQF